MVSSKRSSSTSPNRPVCGFSFGNFKLHADGTLLRGDAEIHLPPKELEALRLLLAHAGQIVTRQQLKKALWGDVHVTEDSVPKCISSLRERLQPDESIQTVYKRGYRISADVRSHNAVSPEALPRLAILPFSAGFNVPAHLGSAIADETISLLTRNRLSPALVLARDSVFTLAARGLTAQQVGEALHADLVLTGSLRTLPEHFRLRAEMIRVADGTQIWVEDLLVPQSRVAGLESELAQRLIVRLNGESLSLSAAAAQEDFDENDPILREAHELFLRGHHEWQTMQRNRMQDGVQHLMRAIELEPSRISPHVDLANASITQAFYGFVSPLDAADKVRWAAKAIVPSSEGAEAILPAVGWIKFHVDRNLTGALRDFAASAHLPHDTSITRLRSMFALSRHRFGEAIDQLSAALLADPFSPWLNARLAWAYHLAGDAPKSIEQIERALELFPGHESASIYGSIILAFNGHTERGIQVAENLARISPYVDLAAAVYGYALACAGRREDAYAILERLQWVSRERFAMSSFTPAVCVALGDMYGAIEALKTAADVHCPWFFQMLADPRLKPLHGRPEFARMQAILAQMEAAAARN
jgi:DNA-binding winged helix-turn-helix (wHTH) protein/tetratricopeptide (TPR) repeat protein